MSDTTTKDDDAASAANVEKVCQRMAAQVAAIKATLVKWLEPRDNEADGICLTNALLEIALDRHIALHEADGFDLIEAAYRRALKRRRATLQ
jgi:hypothetical protein